MRAFIIKHRKNKECVIDFNFHGRNRFKTSIDSYHAPKLFSRHEIDTMLKNNDIPKVYKVIEVELIDTKLLKKKEN